MAAAAKTDRMQIAQGVSYTDLAQKVGVSVAHISFIMSGKRNPSLKVAQRLAGALGCSVDALSRHISRCQAA
jgi:transcriptional regulator with XRE-family HTH domain